MSSTYDEDWLYDELAQRDTDIARLECEVERLAGENEVLAEENRKLKAELFYWFGVEEDKGGEGWNCR